MKHQSKYATFKLNENGSELLVNLKKEGKEKFLEYRQIYYRSYLREFFQNEPLQYIAIPINNKLIPRLGKFVICKDGSFLGVNILTHCWNYDADEKSLFETLKNGNTVKFIGGRMTHDCSEIEIFSHIKNKENHLIIKGKIKSEFDVFYSEIFDYNIPILEFFDSKYIDCHLEKMIQSIAEKNVKMYNKKEFKKQLTGKILKSLGFNL